MLNINSYSNRQQNKPLQIFQIRLLYLFVLIERTDFSPIIQHFCKTVFLQNTSFSCKVIYLPAMFVKNQRKYLTVKGIF